MGSIDLTTFLGCVGAPVELLLDGGESLDGRLTECEPLRAAPGAPRPEPFRLVVTLATGATVAQGTFPVSGAGLVDEPIFFVPIGHDDAGCLQLEAIFN